MRDFTIKFITNKVNYDLLKDNIDIAHKIDELDIHKSEQGILARVIVIVDKPTQLKFSNESLYEDFLGDVVYDSTYQHTFKSIQIKDNAISGSITISVN